MKPVRLFIALLAFLFTEVAPGVPKEDLHVYLLIGQSNMAGRAPLDKVTSAPIERTLLLNDKDEWEPATSPLNRYSTIRKGLGMQKLNPGFSFARAMKKAYPKATLGLVVNAKGGSSIEQWATDQKFYQDIIKRAKAAQKSGTLKGILWHQGESNSTRAELYADQLKALVENLRKDLSTPELPFVAGEIKEGEIINAEIAKLPKSLPATGVASSNGLKTMDRWHFDAPSMITLGERYAAEMLRLQK